MTDLRQAAQAVVDRWDSLSWSWSEKTPTADLIAALRTALEQQAEPVATVTSETGNPDITMSWWHEPALPVGTKLYTAPPQRQWVGLTPEEILDLFDRNNVYGSKWIEFARTVEAKLKEKNDH